MSNSTFKYLDQSSGSDAAQDFLNKKMSKNKYASVSDPENPYSMGEGSTPSGESYPGKTIPGTEKYTPNSREYGSDKWNHGDMGAVNFEDSWNDGAYAQQIKATGPINSDYDEQFAALGKGNSSIDDDGEWVALKEQSNQQAGTAEEFKALAKEWQDAGYDVRVQDLDNSKGANFADIAVRKGPGGKTSSETEAPTPIKHSPEIKQAKERVQSYEQDVLSGKTSEEIYGKGEQQADDKYQLDLDGGAAGIGTNADSQSQEAAGTATASFLDKKVFDVKAKKQFQPTS